LLLIARKVKKPFKGQNTQISISPKIGNNQR